MSRLWARGTQHMIQYVSLNLDKHKSLIKRRLESHLDMESKQYLYHFFVAYQSHHKTIREIFKLSKSSYYWIVGNEDKE